MNHTVLTRCNFKDTDLFYKYFDVMRKVFIPSVKEQICKDFTLLVCINKNIPEHETVIAEEFKGSDVKVVFQDMQGSKTKLIRDKCLIQTRHDCDDYMSSTYVQRIQEIYHENIKTHPEFLIHAQPSKVDYKTGDEYMGRIYTEKATSMFLSLCQRKPVKTILQEQHSRFPSIVPTVFNMGTGYVKLYCHGNNILSEIKKTDIKLSK